METVEIIGLILPWIISLILATVAYLKNGEVIDINETANKTKKILDEVLAFFDPEKPMSETSLDTIYDVIPSASYKMTEEQRNLVFQTCKTEEEINRISNIIDAHENPIAEGDEVCEYELETSGAIFKVEWGTPSLTLLKEESQ